MQLLLKSAVANLVQDVGVARLVDFEGFAAGGQSISCMSERPHFIRCRPCRNLRLANRNSAVFINRVVAKVDTAQAATNTRAVTTC
jgi:hypothetical protein